MEQLLLAAEGVGGTEGVAEEAVKDVAGACGPDPQVYCRWVFEATGSEWAATAAGVIVPATVRILLIALLAYVISKVVKSLLARTVTRAAEESREAIRTIRLRARIAGEAEEEPPELALVEQERAAQRSATIARVAASVAALAVWSVALIMVLSQLGVNVGPLIAGAGIVGVALGFGAQSLVADFISGTFMLLEDQYGIGDVVNVGEATGVVEGISLRVTRLRDVEGTVWHVPNGEIRRVGNMSQLWSQSLLDVGVAYDTDLDLASTIITDVAHGMAVDPEWDDEILEEPEFWGIEQFGADEILLRLVIKVRPATQWAVNREFRRRIKAAFDEAGIEIPFPQRTVWIKSLDPTDSEPSGAVDTTG